MRTSDADAFAFQSRQEDNGMQTYMTGGKRNVGALLHIVTSEACRKHVFANKLVSSPELMRGSV